MLKKESDLAEGEDFHIYYDKDEFDKMVAQDKKEVAPIDPEAIMEQQGDQEFYDPSTVS